MISYYQLGAGKQLNEIVVAGSHDAGITGAARALDDEIQQLQANYAQLQRNVRQRGGRG